MYIKRVKGQIKCKLDKKSIHLCEQKEHNVYVGDLFMTKKGERLK